jgi:hypothetical protein
MSNRLNKIFSVQADKELCEIRSKMLHDLQKERSEIFDKAADEDRGFTEIELLKLRVIQLEINSI